MRRKKLFHEEGVRKVSGIFLLHLLYSFSNIFCIFPDPQERTVLRAVCGVYSFQNISLSAHPLLHGYAIIRPLFAGQPEASLAKILARLNEVKMREWQKINSIDYLWPYYCNHTHIDSLYRVMG